MSNFNRKKVIVVILFIVCMVVIYYFFIRGNAFNGGFDLNAFNFYDGNELVDDNVVNREAKVDKIVVYITGAIKNEGIYELDENSRIADCIELAGGLADDADVGNINLAFVLEDGVKVYIPKKGESNNMIKDDTELYVSRDGGGLVSNYDSDLENSSNTKSASENKKGGKININTATQTELESLPGVGPATATKIIDYRKKNGNFTAIEDIKKVSGIGDSKFNKIKDLIKV